MLPDTTLWRPVGRKELAPLACWLSATVRFPRVLRPLVIAPTEAEWQRLSARERELLVVRVLDSLSDPESAMTEGRRHEKAKTQIIDALELHFEAIGRAVYLAEEMAVLYPGEPVFSPDVLAVLGVREPEDDARLAWVVADEGMRATTARAAEEVFA